MKNFLQLPGPVKGAIAFLILIFLLTPLIHPVIFFVFTGLLVLAGISFSIKVIIAYSNMSKGRREDIKCGYYSFWDAI